MKHLKSILVTLAVLFILPLITGCNNNDDDDSGLLPENPYNGHEYVDLGLSVKWATCNIGATKPEGYGDYFAWGETLSKTTYEWSNYKWCNGTGDLMTKYCLSSEYGQVDNKESIELSDDAARTSWGGDWRIPTETELEELRVKCTWEWTTKNGVNGYKVTSKINGNSIFLPAAGYSSNENLLEVGVSGNYWSNKLIAINSRMASYVYLQSAQTKMNEGVRRCGQSIRAVCGEENTNALYCQISVTTTEGGKATVSDDNVAFGAEVTLEAAPEAGYQFVNWTVDGKEVSKENPYTVTANESTIYKANFKKNDLLNGHEYVDLGLSVKWATCNVGATTPEESGDYFAWGETVTKTTYEWSNYKYGNGEEGLFTKYCTDSKYGTVDNKTTLELSDDAARVNWGKGWRMPTKAELDELQTECLWYWSNKNGVKGFQVKSKINGNSIFLPVTGFYYINRIVLEEEGAYFSSNLSITNSCYAYYNGFQSNTTYVGSLKRYYGQPVRAVCE
ncbi:MAG: hypothetical protein E7083_00655 [Bacteroidales bacterium]|nr:hypothetical protein [Bacteroidales bacterium]